MNLNEKLVTKMRTKNKNVLANYTFIYCIKCFLGAKCWSMPMVFNPFLSWFLLLNTFSPLYAYFLIYIPSEKK